MSTHSWMDRARCLEVGPAFHFPEKGESTREAKKICFACEVRADCLAYAMGNNERYGIFGGMSERERSRLKREAA
jgi:WhiB family redox-sensing transcriptional regulator